MARMSPPGPVAGRLSIRAFVAPVLALLLAVCGREPTAPAASFARLSFAPAFAVGDRPLFQASNASIDNVHLLLRDARGTVVLDTVVTFPPGADEVAITTAVVVHGESEQFAARFELRNGTTVMFEGTQPVTAQPGVNAPNATRVPLVFVGPGARAARVVVTPATMTLLAGASATLTAVAVDADGVPIPGAPIAWGSSNPAIVAVTNTGAITAGTTRGIVAISASTLSGVTGTTTLTVTLPPSRLAVTGGGGQTGTVGSALSTPFTVQVVAADGVPVSGVAVTFAASAGGGTVGAATASTDANGTASTSLTLGRTAGPNSFTASVAGLAPVGITATGTPGAATNVTLVSGDAQAEDIGRTLPAPLVVKVADRFDNGVAGASVSWSRSTGAGTPGAATTTTDAQGLTSIGYTLGTVPGAEAVRASIAAGASVTFAATARALPATTIVAVSGGDQTGPAGSTARQPLVVRVADRYGNPVGGATIAWATSGGGVSVASSTSAADGTASVAFTFPTKSGAASVTATLGGSGPSVSFAMAATYAPASIISLATGGGQSAPAGGTVPIPPAVRITDAYGNVVPGVPVAFAAGSGGSVTGGTTTTNGAGVATVGSWTLGATAGTQTLTVSAISQTYAITATATAAAGPPTLAMATQPSATVASTVVFAQQPAIQLKSPAGANLATAGVVVTVALQTPGPTLRGTLTATTNASGVATFTNLSVLGAVGSNALAFTASGYTGITSTSVAITAGPAVSIAAATATTISAPAGSVVSPVPQVIVKDSANNPVAGVAVTFATPAPGNGGLVTGGGPVTNASGVASPVSWTLDATVGADTLTAAAAGLAGSPVTFVATTTAGAATQLVKVSGDAQSGVTGNPLAAAMVVVAKDALNNPVPGVNVTFTAIAGGGTPASQTIATNGAGQASFTLTLGAPGADTVKACLPSCATAQVLFSALSIPVGADAVWTGATSTAWSTASNWSPAVVPGGSNHVFVPAGTPNSPALSAPISLAHLTMAAGASLNVGANNVSIGGNVLTTGATMPGTGSVYLCGGTHQVSGGLPGLITDCGATVNAAGTVSVGAGMTVTGGSVFAVGTATVTDVGNLDVVSSGNLVMIAAGGVMTVTGNALFAAADHADGSLTDGTLEIRGNFTAQSYGSSFRASGNHLTRFAGTAAQSVYLQYTGGTYSQFANVEVTNTVGVTLTSDVVAVGATLVKTNGVMSGAYTWSAGGVFSSQAGSALGGLAQINVYAGGGTFPLLAGSGPANVNFVNSAVVDAPAGAVTLPTNLVLYGGARLVVGATADLTIAGNLTYPDGQTSRLVMTAPGGKLTVNGNAYFGALDMGDGWLTEGTLTLKGNFAAQTYGSSFRASGNHLTRFVGTAAQSVYMQYTGGSYSQFANVEVTNTIGVNLTSDIVAVGNTLVKTNGVMSGAFTWSIAGLFTAQTGSALSGLAQINVYGGGNTFPLLAGSGPTNVNLVGGAAVNAPATATTLPTNLVLYGGSRLIVGATADLTIAGNLTYPIGQTSRLDMTAPGGKLTVNGNAYFGALDMGDGWLTEGTLTLKGTFTAQNYGSAFRASGNHLTRFAGTAAQSVYMQYTGGSYSQFANVEVTNTVGVNLTSDIVAVGNTQVQTSGVMSGAYTWSIGGLFTALGGTNLSGLAQINVYGGGNTFPLLSGTGPTNVNLVGGAVVNAPATATTLPTNLVLYGGARLTVGATADLTIAGNLTYPIGQTSRLDMTAPGGKLTVNGDAYFAALDMGDGWLTDGTLTLKGNFTAQNYGSAFRASGNHLTRFAGAAAQSVYMQYTGGTYSQFAHVEVSNLSLAGVTPTSTITAVGSLTQLGRLTITSVAFNVGGNVSLGPASITNASGGALNRGGACTVLPGLPGASFTGFSCP